jgi:hypothetical protein
MRLAFDDIIRVHAKFGSASEIIEQRRAVYQLPTELLAEHGSGIADPDVLDNPMTRGSLGAVLSGMRSYDRSALRPVAELAVEPVMVAGCIVRVAGSVSAPDVLADAVDRIGAELGRHGSIARPLTVLTSDRPAFASGYRRLRDGVELAVGVAPGLALDLLAHVALFAMLESDSSSRLGSASVREYPGLVLLPAPISTVEAAEALIHEGAHQKFFDLAITRAIFGPDQYTAPRFAPSWAATAAMRSWPLEQTFAAFHAYCCLAAFFDAVRRWPEHHPVAPSLLPVAAPRAAEIGEWLARHGRFLGHDGHVLLEGLLGRRGAQLESGQEPPADVLAGGGRVIAREFGDRTLVARRGTPVDLSWVPTRAPNPST